MEKNEKNEVEVQGTESTETQSIQVTQEQIKKLGGNKKLAEQIINIMQKRKKLTGTMAFTIAELSI